MITILFLLGAAIVFSFIGAIVMKRLGIPQILGFMLVGVILGLFQIFDENLWKDLYPLVDLALGLIGYSIGLEIRKDVFKGRTRQMGTILILESILTFVVVTLLANWVLGQWHLAIVFGALASATDPASTVMIIWEQKTTGHLTDTLMFVLALDDVVAILLANISITIAVLFYTSPGTMMIAGALLVTALDLILSIVIGGLIGAGMVYFINREDDRARLLELELGLIIMIVGIMAIFEINAILACMVFGFIVVNYVDEDKEPICHTLKTIMAPIVMVFFVIVGAVMDISALASIVAIILVIAYVVGRTLAKYIGAYIGGRISGTPDITTKYLGICLMSQAGVAVGLSLVVEQSFFALGIPEATAAGILIVNVVAMTTMILQVFGPIAASKALSKAGEDFECSVKQELSAQSEDAAAQENTPENSPDGLG